MRFGVFVFRPGLWPTLAGLFFFGLTLWLGNWQLSRTEYKRDLQASYDRLREDGVVQIGAAQVAKAGMLYRPVEVRGEFPELTLNTFAAQEDGTGSGHTARLSLGRAWNGHIPPTN